MPEVDNVAAGIRGIVTEQQPYKKDITTYAEVVGVDGGVEFLLQEKLLNLDQPAYSM